MRRDYACGFTNWHDCVFEQEEARQALKRALDDAFVETSPPSHCNRPYCPYVEPRQTNQEAANDAAFCNSSDQTQPDASHSSDKNGANPIKAAPFFLTFLQMVLRCLKACFSAPLLAFLAIVALSTQCQTNYHPTAPC